MTPRPPSQDGAAALGWLRASLVAVWLGTAAASLAEFHGQSRDLLVAAGLENGAWMQAIIAAGIAADLAVGIWLWWRPGRPAYAAALLLMAAMTAIATVLLPGLWLDPLGRLLKNLPIGAILLVLWRAERKKTHP
ncbi:DoxX-like family protein [Acidovorax sp. NCPPB 4044]|uniref:DoxX-like family protein n=1 Tax=Acidovorax sp. NCPPB 4044 TaxID=2940490 RepID=UPI0023025510|nr:DoxX-like family protein [Acidovorax sp. NCPPB 4044]MDA8521765.1 DoxX-like family protein [Acidovorax sp. NCPPB 4044]